jgi:hypothetical protein
VKPWRRNWITSSNAKEHWVIVDLVGKEAKFKQFQFLIG